MAETNKGLFINRYAKLKDHQEAVRKQNEKKRIAGNQEAKTGKDAEEVINKFRGKTAKVVTKAKPPKAKPPKAKPPAAKPTNKGDGSVKAIPRKTTYQRQVEQKNNVEKNRRKSNFDGVGPSDEQRRKDSSEASVTKGAPRIGSIRTVTKNGKPVKQMWDGKKWVTGKVGGKG